MAPRPTAGVPPQGALALCCAALALLPVSAADGLSGSASARCVHSVPSGTKVDLLARDAVTYITPGGARTRLGRCSEVGTSEGKVRLKEDHALAARVVGLDVRLLQAKSRHAPPGINEFTGVYTVPDHPQIPVHAGQTYAFWFGIQRAPGMAPEYHLQPVLAYNWFGDRQWTTFAALVHSSTGNTITCDGNTSSASGGHLVVKPGDRVMGSIARRGVPGEYVVSAWTSRHGSKPSTCVVRADLTAAVPELVFEGSNIHDCAKLPASKMLMSDLKLDPPPPRNGTAWFGEDCGPPGSPWCLVRGSGSPRSPNCGWDSSKKPGLIFDNVNNWELAPPVALQPSTTTTPQPSTTTPLTTSPRYDCLAGFFNWMKVWPARKKAWCCQHEHRGCPRVPPPMASSFECHAGLANWEAGWSSSKKEWCCKHESLGCPVTTSTTSLPYNCRAGFANWERGWSTGKKAWCCKHIGVGCPTTSSPPFDCHAGLSNWKAGWSGGKKRWCCKHEHRGCAPKEAPVKSHDCKAKPHASWDERKRTWCCEHKGIACHDKMFLQRFRQSPEGSMAKPQGTVWELAVALVAVASCVNVAMLVVAFRRSRARPAAPAQGARIARVYAELGQGHAGLLG